MTTPTAAEAIRAYTDLSREQCCELLARAMGWTVIVGPGSGTWFRTPEDKTRRAPNPFDNLNDYGALREWADGQGISVSVTADHEEAEVQVVMADPDEEWVGTDQKCEPLDYTAERHAVIEAVGRVLELWN